MPLPNVDVDRVLTREEVRAMLLEETIVEDAEIAKTMKRWNYLLKKCWLSKAACNSDPGKILATAWKEEQTYVFLTDKGEVRRRSLCAKAYGYRCVTEISWLYKMPTNAQLEGLSISEIEEISDKFFLVDHPVKCLLDAGFTLRLAVPRDFLGL